MMTLDTLVEFVASTGLALAILLVAGLIWPNWHPGLMACMGAMLVSAALVRFFILLDDTGPGPDVGNVYLNCFIGYAVAFNPLRWHLYPFALYERAAWPRTVTITWLFFSICWHYELAD